MESEEARQVALGFTPEFVPAGQHICYIFSDESERRGVIARYLEAGLAKGEKLLYMVDDMTPDEMLESLRSMGLDVRSDPERLTIVAAASAYGSSDSFNADRMLTSLNTFCSTALEEGYSGARVTGEMPKGILTGKITPEDLLAYEVRVTELLVDHSFTACCQYDARRFDGETIMDMLSVHPLTIVRGQLVKNPYFVPPAIFLKEYRERRSRQTGA